MRACDVDEVDSARENFGRHWEAHIWDTTFTKETAHPAVRMMYDIYVPQKDCFPTLAMGNQEYVSCCLCFSGFRPWVGIVMLLFCALIAQGRFWLLFFHYVSDCVLFVAVNPRL